MNDAIAFVDTGRQSTVLASLLPEEVPPHGYDIWEGETTLFAVECWEPSSHYGTSRTLELMEAPGVPERFLPFREEVRCVGHFARTGWSGATVSRPLAVYRYDSPA